MRWQGNPTRILGGDSILPTAQTQAQVNSTVVTTNGTVAALSGLTAAAQSGTPGYSTTFTKASFHLNDRALIAVEMAKAFMAVPGMLIHDENERAAIAVKNADALIRELQK